MRVKDDKILIGIMDDELRSLYTLINDLRVEYETNYKLDDGDLMNFFSEADSRLTYYKYHIEDETSPPCSQIFNKCDKGSDNDNDCLKCIK